MTAPIKSGISPTKIYRLSEARKIMENKPTGSIRWKDIKTGKEVYP